MHIFSRLAVACCLLTSVVACDSRNDKDIQQLDDAKDARIGVVTGTTGEAITKQLFPDADIKSFDDPMDAVGAVLVGQLDATVTGRPVATLIVRNNPELALLDEPLQPENTSIAVRKDSLELLAQVNKILGDLKADGTLASMQARWFKTTSGPYEEPILDLPTQGEPLRIGVTATREPFNFVDANGRVTGHDGELAYRISVALGRPLEFSNMRFAALIPALQAGKIDMIVTGMTATEERAKFVSFSDSYYENAQVMLVRKPGVGSPAKPDADAPIQIRSNDDLAGIQVGALLGSIQDKYVREQYPTAEVMQYNNAADLVMAVEGQRVDAGVADRDFLNEVLADNAQLAMLETPLFSMDIGAGFEKDNQGLREAFDGFLAGIREDGTYDDMIQRWFVRKERTMPTLPEDGSAGTLTIGTAAFGFPYGAIQDGEFAGFDIELARRFAASQGKQAEFLQMDFGGLIAAQVAGKVDMLVTGMFITPERKERIDFSDPYYNTEIRVFALKQNMGARPAAAPGKPKLTSIGDIHGRRVGVVLGSAQDVYLRKAYPTAEVLQFDHGADLILGLTTDRIDMAVADRDFVRENVATQAQLGVLDEPLFASEVAAGFSKSNPALRADFNAFLANIRADGTYQDMVDRWFKRGERVMPELPAEGSAGVLRVGTSAGGYPFGAVFNGEFSGFDIELARRFAASQGKRAQFSHMQFASLIAALTSGKVDMLTTSMFITEERKERIDFSDPYYATDTRVFALKEKMGAPPRTGSAKPKPTSISDIRAQSGGGPAKPEADAPIQIRSNDDLAGIRVGTVLGSAQDAYVRKNYPTAQVLQYNTSADLVMAVEGSRVDAGVAGRDSLNEILADNTQLAMLETPLFSMDIGAGFKKGNQALREAFNRFLAEIRADGTYDDMVQRWFVRKERTMPTLPAEGTAGTLTIGTATNGFPFGAIQDGKLAGFDIELARRFAASQGKQATFLDMDFGGLIAAQVAGKVDMLVTAMFITPERKERIDFSDPYYSDESRVFALKRNIVQPPKPSGSQLATPADLHGRRIGVMLGSAQEGFATKTFTDSEILQYRTAADLVLAVHDGKVDAGFMDGDPLREILAQQPGFAILGEPLFVSEAGAGFSKASVELRDQFNQFLAGIRADGTYDDMIERWIRGKDSTMPTLPEKPRQGKLTVATNDFGLPFVAVQDGRLVGFDMELAERFAHFLGREVELLNMDWSAVIAATVSGKADVGLGCMFITEERKQNILFSDPYYEAESLAIVLASRAAGADAEAAQPPTAPSWLDGLKASIESNLVRERRYLLIWDGLKTTVVISIFATIFGTLLGGLVCMMRMSSSRWLQWPARSYIAVLRGTPVLVLLMLIFYVVFASVDISPVFVAVVAFGMNFAAYVAEIYRSGIQSIDRGQSEAGIAMGFSRFRTFLYVILPQTVQRILPVYKGEFISLVKMTSIVGYIAVQDLTKASDIIRSRTFDAFFPLVMVAILYFVIAWVLIQALEYLERRTDPKQRRRKAVSK